MDADLAQYDYADITEVMMANQKAYVGLVKPEVIPQQQPVDMLDPESVSMAGLDLPPDASIGEFLKRFGQTMYNMGQSGTAEGLGTVGELESLIRGGVELIGNLEGQPAAQAWEEGIQQETWFPNVEEVRAGMAEMGIEPVGDFTPEDFKAQEEIGGWTGLGGAAVLTGKAVKKALSKEGAAVGSVAASGGAQAADSGNLGQAIAEMESWHSGLPMATNDAKEANKPENERSKDIGFGHKITASEEKSGMIYGIPFKDDQGNYIEISKEDGMKILEEDVKKNVTSARKKWDAKLEAIGSSWDQLDEPYRNALSSLAYNVGGAKAGSKWEKVLKAAADKDVVEFAKELRRKDNRKFTAGMDNRVAKELYYVGLINSLSEVESVLPLANAEQAGIPANEEDILTIHIGGQ